MACYLFGTSLLSEPMLSEWVSKFGWDILCGISKSTFEVPYKISYPYIEIYEFHTKWKF